MQQVGIDGSLNRYVRKDTMTAQFELPPELCSTEAINH